MKITRRARATALACMSALAVVLGSGVGAAHASEDTAASMLGATSAAQTNTITGLEDCTLADGTASLCATTQTMEVSAATRVDVAIIESAPNLTQAQKSEMLAASATTVFYYRTFGYKVTGIFTGLSWTEIHKGGFYYNGSKVWLAVPNYGYTGWHSCDLGGGIAFSVTVNFCGERQRPELGTNVIGEYDNFRVNVIAKGVPIYASHSMWANLYPSGAVYQHYK